MDRPDLSPPEHLLITGGTGFIGRALCHHLLARGHTLTLYVRDPRKAAALYGDRVRCVTAWAELDPGTRVDVVINLAGEPVVGPRWTPRRQAVLEASRSGVTQGLVAWLAGLQHKPRLLLSTSAIGYYGVQATGDPAALAEDAPPQPIFMSTLCQHWENSARAAQAVGVPVGLLRLGVVLGHGGALPGMVMSLRLGLGVVLGSGRQVVSWIHLDDVLGAVTHLMALPRTQASGPFNLTAPQPVTYADLMRAAARVLRRRLLLPVPAFVLRAVLGEQAGLLVEGQRVQPARLLASGYAFRHPEVEGALRQCLA